MFVFLFASYSIQMPEIWFKNSFMVIVWFWKNQYFLFYIFEDMTLTEQFVSLTLYIDTMNEMLIEIFKNTFFTICWSIC